MGGAKNKNTEPFMYEKKKYIKWTNTNISKNIYESIKNAENISILTQYIKDPMTIEDFLGTEKYLQYDIKIVNLVSILFQVYAPLYALRNNFTHYDLHHENVLLYELKQGTFINMQYIYDNETIELKTNKISKIIDYGKAFFKLNEHINSLEIYELICLKDYDGDCGYDSGYHWFKSRKDPYEAYYIDSKKNNQSHDLRLVKEILRLNNENEDTNHPLNALFNNVVYDYRFGTKEKKTEGKTINNITDLNSALRKYVIDPHYSNCMHQIYRNQQCIGTLKIYMDVQKDMEFVEY